MDYCAICEKTDCATPINERYGDYRLKYISHGAHALDFCERMGVLPDESWNEIPVLFLFENPSIQYDDQYEICEGKCPAKKWYWLRDGNGETDFSYPKYYKQGYYGDLVASLIKTFKLSNSYMTNFVKCAMNDADGKHYLGTAEYREECIDNCFKNVLLKEVEVLTNNFEKELIVFAFSLRVYDLVQQYFTQKEQLRGKCSLCLMPHPASRLANDYRKYVIFGKVFKALRNKGVGCESAIKEFLERDKAENIPSFRFGEANQAELKTRFEERGIRIKDNKIGKDNTGTIKLTSTELKCKFKLLDGVFEFGVVLDADVLFWIWDSSKREYIGSADAVSAKLGELYDIFRNYIYELEARNSKD